MQVFIFKQTYTVILTAIVNKFTIEWNKKHRQQKQHFCATLQECLAAHSCSCENWDSHMSSGTKHHAVCYIYHPWRWR